MNKKNCIVISGLLIHLSDNILPFLNKDTDVYVHTYDIPINKRWIVKLNRYRKYVNSLYVKVENIKFNRKLHSYFYSTYRAVNIIKNINQYDTIIKFKPNVEGDITYVGDLPYYFQKGYLQSRPLLEGYKKEDCIYGSIYYQTLDERIFSGYPLAFKKMFHILEEDFTHQMYSLNKKLSTQYGEDYEGSIFWKEWAEGRDVKQVLDIDLKIPNSKPWQH